MRLYKYLRENIMNYENMLIDTIKTGVKDIVKEDESLEPFNHFVVFYKINGEGIIIYHMVGYEEEPNQESINHNIEELQIDEDLKLDNDIFEGLQYRVVKIKE